MKREDDQKSGRSGGAAPKRAAHAAIVQARGLVGNPGIKFLRDLFSLLSAQFVVKLVGFATFAYLARVLTPDGYGAVEFVLAVVGLALLFVDFGLGNVGVRRRLHGEMDDELVSEIATIRTIIAVFAAPAVVATIYFNFEDNEIRGLGLLGAATLFLVAWKQEWLLQSVETIGAIAFGHLIKAITFAVLVVFFVTGPENILRVGIAEFVATFLWVGFLLTRQRAVGIPIRMSFGRKRAGELVRDASSLAGTQQVWGLVQYLPPIAVGLMAGLESAALFAVAQRIVTSLQSVSYLYHFNLYASLVRRLAQGREAFGNLVMASNRIIAWGLIGPAIFCAGHAGDVTALAFGEAYRAAGPVLAILIFAVPIQFLSGHQRWALAASGKNHLVLFSTSAGAAIMCLGIAVLIPVFGTTGAAAAVVLATTVTWGAAVYCCRRCGFQMNPLYSLIRPVTLAIGVHFAVTWIVDSWWIWRFALEFALYGGMLALVDRDFFPNLRHVAYAKKQVADVS